MSRVSALLVSWHPGAGAWIEPGYQSRHESVAIHSATGNAASSSTHRSGTERDKGISVSRLCAVSLPAAVCLNASDENFTQITPEEKADATYTGYRKFL